VTSAGGRGGNDGRSYAELVSATPTSRPDCLSRVCSGAGTFRGGQDSCCHCVLPADTYSKDSLGDWHFISECRCSSPSTVVYRHAVGSFVVAEGSMFSMPLSELPPFRPCFASAVLCPAWTGLHRFDMLLHRLIHRLHLSKLQPRLHPPTMLPLPTCHCSMSSWRRSATSQ
jgi:hypothetical protein